MSITPLNWELIWNERFLNSAGDGTDETWSEGIVGTAARMDTNFPVPSIVSDADLAALDWGATACRMSADSGAGEGVVLENIGLSLTNFFGSFEFVAQDVSSTSLYRLLQIADGSYTTGNTLFRFDIYNPTSSQPQMRALVRSDGGSTAATVDIEEDTKYLVQFRWQRTTGDLEIRLNGVVIHTDDITGTDLTAKEGDRIAIGAASIASGACQVTVSEIQIDPNYWVPDMPKTVLKGNIRKLFNPFDSTTW